MSCKGRMGVQGGRVQKELPGHVLFRNPLQGAKQMAHLHFLLLGVDCISKIRNTEGEIHTFFRAAQLRKRRSRHTHNRPIWRYPVHSAWNIPYRDCCVHCKVLDLVEHSIGAPQIAKKSGIRKVQMSTQTGLTRLGTIKGSVSNEDDIASIG